MIRSQTLYLLTWFGNYEPAARVDSGLSEIREDLGYTEEMRAQIAALGEGEMWSEPDGHRIVRLPDAVASMERVENPAVALASLLNWEWHRKAQFADAESVDFVYAKWAKEHGASAVGPFYAGSAIDHGSAIETDVCCVAWVIDGNANTDPFAAVGDARFPEQPSAHYGLSDHDAAMVAAVNVPAGVCGASEKAVRLSLGAYL